MDYTAITGVMSFFGGVLTTTAVVGVVAWLGRTTFEKWLSSRFETELQAFKHRQSLEIENLRHRFGALIDRKLKLNQQEFEIIPRLWLLMNTSYSEISQLVSRGREVPALDRLSDERLEEWLASIELLESAKKRIREIKPPERQTIFLEESAWPKLGRAQDYFAKYHNAVLDEGFFLPVELEAKLKAMSELQIGAISERKISLNMFEKIPTLRDHADRLLKDGPVLQQEIKTMIRARLWKDAEEAENADAKTGGSHP